MIQHLCQRLQINVCAYKRIYRFDVIVQRRQVQRGESAVKCDMKRS